MKWYSVISLLVVTSLAVAGCDVGGGTRGASRPGGAGIPGATPGGAQDIGLARDLIASGVVPPPEAITIEGVLSEHDFPLDGPECTSTLCIRGALGWQDEAGWLQLALTSAIDMDAYERASQGIVFVVDVSGSMGWAYAPYGEPALVARDLLDAMIAFLDEDDRVGLVTFATESDRVLEFVPGDEQELLEETINDLAVGGSTNMEAGLSDAQDMFSEADLEVELKRVILLTDAQPNVGATRPDSFTDLAQQLSDEDVGLTVIGTGVGLNPGVMDSMVNLRGGNGFSIATAAEVPDFMDDHWPWMVSPIAYDLVVGVAPGTGFVVGEGYGFPGDGEMTAATVFLSRRDGALLVRLDGAPFATLEADLEIEYESFAGDSFIQSLTLELPVDAALDPDGRYYEQYSVRKATAIVLLFESMREAAELYASFPVVAVGVLEDAVARYESDVAALLELSSDDEVALIRELTLAEDMLALMFAGAAQGTLYGP